MFTLDDLFFNKRVGFMKEFDQKYAEMELENLPNTDISCY